MASEQKEGSKQWAVGGERWAVGFRFPEELRASATVDGRPTERSSYILIIRHPTSHIRHLASHILSSKKTFVQFIVASNHGRRRKMIDNTSATRRAHALSQRRVIQQLIRDPRKLGTVAHFHEMARLA